MGIGTTNPGAKLDVKGSTDGILRISTGRNSSSDIGALDFWWSGEPHARISVSAAGNTSNLHFLVRDGGTTAVEKMRITTSGNVGIGTTSPGQKLDVAGNVKATSFISNGTLTTSSAQHTLKTPYGYVEIGPKNTSHAHIYTDTPDFYFNKPLLVNGKAVSMADHTHAYLPLTGGTIDGDLYIGKSNGARWLTLPGAAPSDQRTGISIGESGKWGSAALHIYYTGDGVGHIGMGTMSGSTNAANEAIRLSYTSRDVTFLGNINATGKTITATTFSGNASSASSVSTSAENSNATSRFILFADKASGNQALKTDSGLKYVPSTNTISATFSGNLTGNVTGNVSGSAGSTANWAGNTYTNSNITNEVYLMTSTNGTV